MYLTYSFTHKVHSAILIPSTTLLLYIFASYFTSLLFVIFRLPFTENLFLTFVFMCVIYVILVRFVKLMSDRITKKIEISNFLKWALSVFSLLIFISYFVIIIIERFQGHLSSMGQANAAFIIGYGVVSAIVFLMLIYSSQKEQAANQRHQEMRYLKEYTDQLEKNNQEMRRFKHDYQNILLSIEEYISQGDIVGLEEYFFKNIRQTSKFMNSNILKLSQLVNLEIQELKSLFANKLLISQEKGIHTEVEINEKIDNVDVNMLLLVRAIGIILDNAVEAAEDVPDGFVRVAMVKRETATIIIVENSCSFDMPKLHILKQEGFSTKGKNRGLGLSNLDRMIKSEKKLVLETRIENSRFYQILSIGG